MHNLASINDLQSDILAIAYVLTCFGIALYWLIK